jgi:hypothetical protein
LLRKYGGDAEHGAPTAATDSQANMLISSAKSEKTGKSRKKPRQELPAKVARTVKNRQENP